MTKFCSAVVRATNAAGPVSAETAISSSAAIRFHGRCAKSDPAFARTSRKARLRDRRVVELLDPGCALSATGDGAKLSAAVPPPNRGPPRLSLIWADLISASHLGSGLANHE